MTVLILIFEAVVAYGLILGSHALRDRFGLRPYYALMGAVTAIMSWVTDAGVAVEVVGITFLVGSTVFYTALLLGVFVVYVFDGPVAARTSIFIVMGVSALTPLLAATIHWQAQLAGLSPWAAVPTPSLRINAASIITTLMDLFFLAIAWEFLIRRSLKVPMWVCVFLILLGVMWLDLFLFVTGAFAGSPAYLSILKGHFFSRLIVSICVAPLGWVYLNWQHKRQGTPWEHRPILAILQRLTEVKRELSVAQREIERRKQAEAEREKLIAELQKTLAEVKTLRGFLPICSNCKKIRDDEGYWQQIEKYIQEHSEAEFSHGICPDCLKKLYPDLADRIIDEGDEEKE